MQLLSNIFDHDNYQQGYLEGKGGHYGRKLIRSGPTVNGRGII